MNLGEVLNALQSPAAWALLSAVAGVVLGWGLRWVKELWRERTGFHVKIEPYSAITTVGLSAEVVIRLRLRNKVHRTISFQVSYGDDPRYLESHPTLSPYSTVLGQASFSRDGDGQPSGLFKIGPHDGADIEMRLKPKTAGDAALFVSVISHGFEGKWVRQGPYTIHVDP